MKRKICVITGTRAEYGLLSPLLREIKNSSNCQLQIIVTGMHLSPEFGLTYKEIETDSFFIDAKVDLKLSGDSPQAIAHSMGLGTIGFADTFAKLQPDIIVFLGDRFEILSAAQAAMLARIPMAHIQGGEATEGLIDEAIRHALTKMSHIHFTANEVYRKRVIQLGENPDRVFNFGSLAIDCVKSISLIGKKTLEEELDLRFSKINFLITYHPVTLEKENPKEKMQALLDALDEFPAANCIFTKPNADTDGRIIAQMIDQYVAKNKARAFVYTSLGQKRYFSVMNQVDLVVGNSSSGIVEAPLFSKITINLGNRQGGRVRGNSVIQCEETKKSVVAAMKQGLNSKFKPKSIETLYGNQPAAPHIMKVLANIKLDTILVKKFYDITF